MKLFINVCCQFTAQVGNTNQGYLGNNGNNGNTGNPNNGNNPAQVGNTNQGYQGNNGDINSYSGNNGNNANNGNAQNVNPQNANPQNTNNQAVFQNDAKTQVGQQIAPQNNYPNGKQQSLQQIYIFVLCNF